MMSPLRYSPLIRRIRLNSLIHQQVQRMSQVFSECAEGLIMYTTYVTNYAAAIATIRSLLQEVHFIWLVELEPTSHMCRWRLSQNSTIAKLPSKRQRALTCQLCWSHRFRYLFSSPTPFLELMHKYFRGCQGIGCFCSSSWRTRRPQRLCTPRCLPLQRRSATSLSI